MTISLQIRQIHYLVMAMILISGILLSLIIFILVYLVYVKAREKRNINWLHNIDLLIRRAIFFEEEESEEELIPLTPKIEKWLKDAVFRQFLIDEMVKAKKSLTGSASSNLERLFSQLHLDAKSLKKLRSSKWHIKARGIQELALMNRKEAVPRIYRLTNNRNEFIRMEAQLAIVHFYGFEGLRFLDTLSLPISEWHQIKLLSELPKASAITFKGMKGWLGSSNHSVILLALKLAGIYRRFEMHDRVTGCLEHPDPAIPVQAVICLRQIGNESTAGEIIRHYSRNGLPYQAAVLEALQQIATEKEIPFLEGELTNRNDDLKLAAARALLGIGVRGEQMLDGFAYAQEYPWNEIIRQVKSEKAA